MFPTALGEEGPGYHCSGLSRWLFSLCVLSSTHGPATPSAWTAVVASEEKKASLVLDTYMWLLISGPRVLGGTGQDLSQLGGKVAIWCFTSPVQPKWLENTFVYLCSRLVISPCWLGVNPSPCKDVTECDSISLIHSVTPTHLTW